MKFFLNCMQRSSGRQRSLRWTVMKFSYLVSSSPLVQLLGQLSYPHWLHWSSCHLLTAEAQDTQSMLQLTVLQKRVIPEDHLDRQTQPSVTWSFDRSKLVMLNSVLRLSPISLCATSIAEESYQTVPISTSLQLNKNWITTIISGQVVLLFSSFWESIPFKS